MRRRNDCSLKKKEEIEARVSKLQLVSFVPLLTMFSETRVAKGILLLGGRKHFYRD